jgi:hypothetical protein
MRGCECPEFPGFPRSSHDEKPEPVARAGDEMKKILGPPADVKVGGSAARGNGGSILTDSTGVE